MSITIWIDKKDKEKIIKKIEKASVDEPVFEGLDIEDLYIDEDTGELVGFIGIEELGVGINIPFQEWFSEFLKFNSFDELIKFLENHRQEVEKAIKKVNKVKKLIKTKSKNP